MYTLTVMLRIFVGVHISKIRALSHEPWQRLTSTNRGEFLRSVTPGSTWTTSENNPHFISEGWSVSERKYALVDVIKHDAGAKMIYKGRFYLGSAWRVMGRSTGWLRANDTSVCFLLYTPRWVPNAVNSTLSSPLPSRSMWVAWVRHRPQFLHSWV